MPMTVCHIRSDLTRTPLRKSAMNTGIELLSNTHDLIADPSLATQHFSCRVIRFEAPRLYLNFHIRLICRKPVNRAKILRSTVQERDDPFPISAN